MVAPNDYLRLSKPLYGMCDSGYYWEVTFTEYVRKKMKMMLMTGDPSLNIRKIGGRTIGILVSYVDDCLFARDRTFNRFIEYARTNFESKLFEWDNV